MAFIQFLPRDNAIDVVVKPFITAATREAIEDAELYMAVGSITQKGQILAASDTDPIVIGSTAHGLTTGNNAIIVGTAGNGAAKGVWPVTVTGADTFSLDGSEGDGAYVGDGWWYRAITAAIQLDYQGDNLYLGQIPGSTGLVAGVSYAVVLFCLGAYRDDYSEVVKVPCLVRGGGA